jgi:DNA polymerase-4
MTRKIIHVDMDSFYASIEERDRPEIQGCPIAVGGSPDSRGVIATANYEARRYGVRSAISSARAVQLCPHLILIRADFDKYKTESQKIRGIFSEYTELIEPLSLDEAFLDVTDCTQCYSSATMIASEIRGRIHKDTGLTASAGVAPNKFLAKIASDWNKPDGQKVIPPEDVDQFVRILPIEKIFGVGKVTAAKMKDLNLHTCGDLAKWSIEELLKHFGKWGGELFYLCRGIDERPVSPHREPKSLSVEYTYDEDLPDLESCIDRLPTLYTELLQRLEVDSQLRNKIRGLFVKVKFNDFQTTTLARTRYTSPSLDTYRELLVQAYARGERPVRLLGLGVRLISELDLEGLAVQLELFPESLIHEWKNWLASGT